MRRRTQALFVAAVAGSIFLAASGSSAQNFPDMSLNERMIISLGVSDGRRSCGPELLAAVLREAGNTATVYPSENYYYFRFSSGGRGLAGSLRLPADSRDRGVIQLSCYEDIVPWLTFVEPENTTVELGPTDGVRITKVGRLSYRLSFRGASTRFDLYDLDQRPNAAAIGPDEIFVGRLMDESGLRFDLLLHRPSGSFFYVLDTRGGTPETFVRAPAMLVGRRTGFAFWVDTAREQRLILVAVHAGEVHRNSYLDGPFDQLPENFYDELAFWENIYSVYPDLRGRLSPGGTMLGTDVIFAISSYGQYEHREDLARYADCHGADMGELSPCLLENELESESGSLAVPSDQ